jgi:hypothetical protein
LPAVDGRQDMVDELDALGYDCFSSTDAHSAYLRVT